MNPDSSSPAHRSFLSKLRNWANSPEAENDLQQTFGESLNWVSAFRHLESLKRGDFSLLPRIEVLPDRAMEALWGGYSRDLRVVFLSADCPEELIVPVLLEEVGHFFDQELCTTETPGDEGAVFASLVLGTGLDRWAATEDDLEVLDFRGMTVPVEAARKTRGSRGKSGKSSRKGRGKGRARVAQDSGSGGGSQAVTSRDGGTVYTYEDSARIPQGKNGQRLIGTTGNDTFQVTSQDVKIEDLGGTDTVETPVSFSLENFGVIENLALTGSGNIAGTGNFKANVITGNSGNNLLNGGDDSVADTLIGGAGDDTYVFNDTLDQIVEAKGQGSDTILTTINNLSLADLAIENVENLTFAGEDSATLSGNALANVLTGGKQADTLFGSEGDTLIGWQGDDVYYVSSVTTRVLELDGPLDGNDTISTGLANYSMAASKNVEALIYTGSSNSTLTGNTGNNSIYGALVPRNTINGGDGDDYLFGGDTTDSLVGGAGNDTLAVTRWVGNQTGALGSALRANRGNDTLAGGEGNDWYIVDSQTAFNYQDTLGSNTIASTVDFSLKYNANISANIQNLYLIGGSDLRGSGSDIANSITGNDGGNTISAAAGNDTVYGGLGADLISGEAGNDTLIGGGQPQTDLADDASTPVEIQSGQTYEGKFELRFDEDWVKVAFNEGETYAITLVASLSGNDIFKENSWIYLGDPVEKDGYSAYGDTQYLNNYSSTDYWWGEWWSYNYDGYDDNKFEVAYNFTAFDSGEFYLPVVVGGPSTGSYSLNVQSNSSSQSAFGEVLADDGQNTIMGGLGNDFLVAGNGRDTLGAPIGDILLGGTNGMPGSTDLDSSTKQNITASLIAKKGYYKIESLGTTNWSILGAASQVVGTIFQATLDGSLVGGTGVVEVPRDSLIGGAGGDLLDAGNGMDLMIGGSGNDTYFVDYPFDIVIEGDSGGHDDIAIFSHGVTRALTGAAYDVNLSDRFTNVEHASLVGSAHLHVLGNSDPNSLHGNFGDNLLDGHAGNDSLLGQGGNDYLIGDDGGDLLDGGSGQNTMDGGLGDDTYVVNDRSDRVINEIAGLDGGIDLVRTYFNFDPIQGSELEQFQPNHPDNSPSRNKAPSFASEDIKSFYNLEHFELIGDAAYGVGNALGNSLLAGESAALLLGMGGEDTLIGNSGNDSIYGDTPDFYASPDLYAPAPVDTRNREFLDSVIGAFGSDYLDGGDGDDYLDGGKGFDTMIGGAGNDTFVQDNVDDYVVAGDGANELISSVNIAQTPDGISKLMLVVADQAPDSGQPEVAESASFLGTANGNNLTTTVRFGGTAFVIQDSNLMELMYAPREADRFVIGGVTDTTDAPGNPDVHALNVSVYYDDLDFPGRKKVDLSWVAGAYADTGVVGYTVRYKQLTNSNGTSFLDDDGNPDIWHTYVNGTSQDFQGTQAAPSLTIRNLADGAYDFEVVAHELAIPALISRDPDSARHVTLQGGAGNDAINGLRLIRTIHGGLVDDAWTNPLLLNNPNGLLPLGFIFNPAPYNVDPSRPDRFATYLDGGFGNDFLNGDYVNDGSGDDYTFQNVVFKGLNTLVGGQGSDTFVVKNGGNAIGDEFDWVVKYGNETPVDFGAGGVGESLNGGQHNLVFSLVDYLTLSDTIVSQGKFIDRLQVNGGFGMGNRLENYVFGSGTLVGNTGRDSIEGVGLLHGGTAYGKDDVGMAVRDFAGVVYGGYGLVESVFRDTDPVPTDPNGPGAADLSQFWNLLGYYGPVYDPNRNQDTLIANGSSTLDGGAGRDSLVGSGSSDMFYVSQGNGGSGSQDIASQDAVFGNEGNDTVMFTDSDYLWWTGHQQGGLLAKNSYSIERFPSESDISNLILQAGSPSARNAFGNNDSKGNPGLGSNMIVGNEFDNVIDGGGVGGDDERGTGVDVLVGGSGSDNFVVSGYTSSDTNEWNPEIIDYEDGPLAGFSLWKPLESVYTDADYAVIQDFEAGDNLQLSGSTAGYWIGAAPGINSIPTNIEAGVSIPLLGYLATPSTTRFGIYTAGGPNLVAIVNLVGGLELDPLSLELAYDPAPSNIVATNSSFRNHLGWGTFWRLEGSSFEKYVNQSYNPEDSFASLETLVRSGDDTFTGGALADFYNGFGGNDSLLGGGGNDTLLGESGNDRLFGEAGDDSLLGGKGADFIDGGLGVDVMIGSLGDDTYIVDSLADVVTETDADTVTGGVDWVGASVDGYSLTANVENLTLLSPATSGTGNELGNRLIGNALNNILTGLDGNDTLIGVGGVNVLDGGADDDYYIVDTDDDTILDSGGAADTVQSSVAFDLSNALVAGGTGIEHLIYTGSGGASLTGNAAQNSITGSAGSETLNGQGGIDTLIGGAGDDFYILTIINTDVIVEEEGAGTDTVLIDGTFSISSQPNIENIELTAAVASILTGNSQDNLITGNILNDNISGGGGNDTLSGSSAAGNGEIDTLTGGAGADLFVLGDSGAVFYNDFADGDYALINDFNIEQGDRLQLHGGNYIFGAGSGVFSSLYLDSDGSEDLSVGDNLIAKIKATGGGGEEGNLVGSDLAKIVIYA